MGGAGTHAAAAAAVLAAIVLTVPGHARADGFGPWRGTVTPDQSRTTVPGETYHNHVVYTLQGTTDGVTYTADAAYSYQEDLDSTNDCGQSYDHYRASGTLQALVIIQPNNDGSWEFGPAQLTNATFLHTTLTSFRDGNGDCRSTSSSETFQGTIGVDQWTTEQQPTAGGTVFQGEEDRSCCDEQPVVYVDKWDLSRAAPACNRVSDFDGDGKTDVAVYRPSEGRWYINRSSDGGLALVNWGTASDIPLPADYDGDGKTDVAVYRPSEGRWYVLRSSNGASGFENFGTSTDTPVPADYDGDCKADFAVYRPGEGRWYIHRSSDGAVSFTNWGASTDIPVPGDYNGDGAAEPAVYRPSEARWYRVGSAFVDWGTNGDVPVPAAYGTPGVTQVAVWRPGEGRWYFQGTSSFIVDWGVSTDRPEPGDYDGDGVANVAVFRPSEGRWYANGGILADFGLSSDIPLVLPYAIRKVYFP
jgi:hypothetical protein